MYICRFLYVQSVHASKSQCGFKVSMPQNVTTLSQVRLGRFLGPEDDDRRQNKDSPKSNFATSSRPWTPNYPMDMVIRISKLKFRYLCV